MKISTFLCSALLAWSAPIASADLLDIPTMQTTNMGVAVEILDIYERESGSVRANVRIHNETLESISLNATQGDTVVITSDGRLLPLVPSTRNPLLEVDPGEAILAQLSFVGSRGSDSDELTLVFNANKERDDAAPLIEFNNIGI